MRRTSTRTPIRGPTLRGAGLAVLVALAVYAAAVVTETSVGWARCGPAAQAAVSLLIGGCGVALAVLQPKGTGRDSGEHGPT